MSLTTDSYVFTSPECAFVRRCEASHNWDNAEYRLGRAAYLAGEPWADMTSDMARLGWIEGEEDAKAFDEWAKREDEYHGV